MAEATAAKTTPGPLYFELGDNVVEVIGEGVSAKRIKTTIVRLTSDRVCQTGTRREYDRLTGAPVPPVAGYRGIHSADRYAGVGKGGAE